MCGCREFFINLTWYKHKSYRFLGISEGGVETCVYVPRFKLMFDIGRCASRLVSVPRLLVTHGHTDHSAGIPYYISQRNLRKLPAADIYVPPEMAPLLQEILQLWSRLEGYQAEYRLHALDHSKCYYLEENFYFQSIPTIHRVPSNGYIIFEKRRKLQPQFIGLSSEKIQQLKKEQEEELFYEMAIPLIAFSGDTQIEFVLDNEVVRQAKILFLECTYIDDDRPVERARQWGHLHLDELVENVEAFRETERLFLLHFSPRYGKDKICKTLKKRLPTWLYQRTTPFLTYPSKAPS